MSVLSPSLLFLSFFPFIQRGNDLRVEGEGRYQEKEGSVVAVGKLVSIRATSRRGRVCFPTTATVSSCSPPDSKPNAVSGKVRKQRRQLDDMLCDRRTVTV